ncbi:hypothetical protein U1Q18_004661 [Sarracenia purpurea var. burkii]
MVSSSSHVNQTTYIPAMGDFLSGSKISLDMEASQQPVLGVAEGLTSCAPLKGTTSGGDVFEGTSPLSISLKPNLDKSPVQNVEAILNEEVTNDEDEQEQGELESFEIKRRSLLRDKALAEKDLQYLDEAHQQFLEKSRKAKGKAPLVDEGGPNRDQFIPRSVQFQGGRFQRGGRGGGRAPMGRPWSRAAEEGTVSSEGPQVEPKVFVERPKRSWASLLTNRCPTGDLDFFEANDPEHPEGKAVEAEKQTVEPAEETILGESEDQGLGNFQVPTERGSLVEEVSENVATASQVSPKSLEIIPIDSTEEGKDVQVSQATALQSQSEDSAEAQCSPASKNLKSKPPDNKKGSSSVWFGLVIAAGASWSAVISRGVQFLLLPLLGGCASSGCCLVAVHPGLLSF